MLIKDLPFYSEKTDLSKMVKNINVSYPDGIRKYKIFGNGNNFYTSKIDNLKMGLYNVSDREVYPEDVITGYVFSNNTKSKLPNELKNSDLKIFKSLNEVDNFINNSSLEKLIYKQYVYKVNFYSGEIELIEKYTNILKYYYKIYKNNNHNLTFSGSRNGKNPIKTNVIKFYCNENNKDKFIISIRNMRKNSELKNSISAHFKLSKCKSFFYTDTLENIDGFIFLFKLENFNMNEKIYVCSLRNNLINIERLKFDETS